MDLVKLTVQEQFESLEKGDIVYVQWYPHASEYNPDKAQHYKIWGINHSNELILDGKLNTWFSIQKYLERDSRVESVYVVKL